LSIKKKVVPLQPEIFKQKFCGFQRDRLLLVGFWLLFFLVKSEQKSINKNKQQPKTNKQQPFKVSE